ncbi:hypothetical protein MHI43_17125 [Paenibacillus sp. FSL H8-0457]
MKPKFTDNLTKDKGMIAKKRQPIQLPYSELKNTICSVNELRQGHSK